MGPDEGNNDDPEDFHFGEVRNVLLFYLFIYLFTYSKALFLFILHVVFKHTLMERFLHFTYNLRSRKEHSFQLNIF